MFTLGRVYMRRASLKVSLRRVYQWKVSLRMVYLRKVYSSCCSRDHSEASSALE